MIQCAAAVQCPRASHHSILRFVPPISPSNNVSATSSPASSSSVTSRRAALSLSLFSATFSALIFSPPASSSSSKSAISEFRELPNSGGVKVLDVRFGSGELPLDGDQVAIHYYGRLAAKQGWRFDSTYDHKDENGEPIPFVFVLGSGKVISGIEAAVRSMKVGGIRRVIIPQSQGYQSTSQEPIPPNFFDRQRLFTTIFNPTRLANGEGSTLGTLIFDIEFVSARHQ
ncbi:peptidyl-prolyl cis-trans isomerase FKBP17-1, chloroplastic isoform X1 [Alnus glutinosa]|uniref:peptidyl-prolyl cis-trans isomerase FKBP17-1, chloroplastic isoform X1 n=1 Tax=Alnus glutinosa TaxID=3517 RepID=UPI002D792286|nr:peptidyl-prolyl cis-trans isomerase FKBP17-1, chloroplastic isoform X1 [Alnus glutinosa]